MTWIKLFGIKLLIGGSLAAVAVSTVISFMERSPEAHGFDKDTVNLTTEPESAVVGFVKMLPGDAVINPLVISNDGSLPLRYSVTSMATNDDRLGLKDQLILTIKTIDASAPTENCTKFDGISLYSGDLDSTAGQILGDPAIGQDGLPSAGGDRQLGSSTSETLCFRVSLPLETGNSFQAASTIATFTFGAEQIVDR